MGYARVMVRFALMLLLLPVLATAESAVYRWVGPDGSVHFTDEPRPGAEKVIIGPVQVVPRLQTPKPGDVDHEAEAGSGAGGYQDFSFSAPAPDEAIRANNGVVGVRLSLSPGLRPGHEVRVSLDGQPMGGSAPLSFELPGLSRGTHTIQAEVVDQTGNTVVTAGPVTFHVLRASVGGP